MTTIQAIQTEYKGYRFRSRLEARWAVFFDTLGIKYEYEPQGFELPAGNYLPDFWLPGINGYIEIKGKDPTEEEGLLATQLARATGKYVYVFFGDIPDPEDPYHHFWSSGSSHAYFGGHISISTRNKNVGRVYSQIHYAELKESTVDDVLALNDRWNSFFQNSLVKGNADPSVVNGSYLMRKHLQLYLKADSFEDIEDRCRKIRFTGLYSDQNYRVESLSDCGGFDMPYAWTICPDCSRTGIAFSGWSERICLCSSAYKDGYDHPRIIEAYRAARSARFEHGETPRVPRGKPKK